MSYDQGLRNWETLVGTRDPFRCRSINTVPTSKMQIFDVVYESGCTNRDTADIYRFAQ